MTDVHLLEALENAVPFRSDEPFRIVELGTGDTPVAERLLQRFSAASLVAMANDEASRDLATRRLAPFGGRVTPRTFVLDTLDWWDVLFGADLVVAVNTLQLLNDAKTQYLYKAAADRLSDRAAFLVAGHLPDRPSALLHQLIWLRHAGFARVECAWLVDRAAVFGGFKGL
jgi:trans-aconitate methyltransferase